VFHGQSIMDGSAPTEAARSQGATEAKAPGNAPENAQGNAREKRDEPEVKVP
jgi:hypothetical protein